MSTSVEAALRARIDAEGSIGLDVFMEAANAAYYATGDVIGAAGDFITAPEISQCFGELVGLWAAVTWQSLGAALSALQLGRGTRWCWLRMQLVQRRRVAAAAAVAAAVAAAGVVEVGPVAALSSRARCAV